MTLEIKKPELAALIEELKKSDANLDEVLFDSLTARKPATSEAPVATGQEKLGAAFRRITLSRT